MPSIQNRAPDDAIILGPEEGRIYEMGFMRAVFKADGAETGDRYSISEWWLEPQQQGPGAHRHDENDEIFYVLEGKASLLIGDQWHELQRGSFVRIPAGIMHDFENRTDERLGLLNLFIPGGFEQKMPLIVNWFAQNRPAEPPSNAT